MRYSPVVVGGVVATFLILASILPQRPAITTVAATASPALVQVAQVRVTSGQRVNLTLPNATKAGDLIVAAVVWDNLGAVSLSDSTGSSYAGAAGPTHWSSTNDQSLEVFYATSSAGGAATVSATFATPIQRFGILYVHEYTGIDTAHPLDVSTAASGSSGDLTSGSATTTNANDLLFAVGISDNTVTSVGGGFTMRSTAYGNATADKIVTTAGSYGATADQNGNAWVMQMVAFRAASAGAPARKATNTPTVTNTPTATWTPIPPTATETATTAPTAMSIAINSGGGAVGSFSADTGYSGGNTYVSSNQIDTSGVTNPAPQAVYQSERYGNFTYIVPNLTPGAPYTVRLHFAEVWWSAPGQRIFNVAINGTPVLSNFDIVAAAGAPNKALVKAFTATASSTGTLSIQYTTVKDNAKSSGIEVMPLSPTAVPNNTPTQTPSSTPTATSTKAPPTATATSTKSSTPTATSKATATNTPTSTPTSTAGTSAITRPLQVLASNPHFFTDGSGRAILLSGSHTWNDFQDSSQSSPPAPFDFASYVNFLSAHGHNMTILWKKDLPTICNWGAGGNWHLSPFPWPRTGPGTASDGLPAFDLSQFNQAYFDRLRARVITLLQHNIYATVQLFDGLDLINNRCSTDGYPFSAGNNINGIADGGGANSMTMQAPNAITQIQDAYVRKVIDTLNDLPNVLWEVSEEAPSNSTWWQNHMIALIHSYEATKPLQHPVGYPMLTGGTDATLYASTAEWVAPSARIAPPNNQGKVIVDDSDHSYYGMWNDSAQTNRNFIWENFTNGASVLFMDPYEIYWSSGNRNVCPQPVNGVCSGVDARWNNVRANLGYILSYAARMNLAAMTPQGSRASTGYALVNSAAHGGEDLVYAPYGGIFTVDLSNTRDPMSVEWFNPATGTRSAGGTVSGGSSAQSFTPPFSGDAVLYLRDAAP